MVINKIKLTDIISRTEEAIVSELDGEVVMMNVEKGEYYGLGKVGSVVWRLLEQPLTVREIIGKCIEQYEVDFEQCQQDILPFLTQLYQKGLISFS